MSNGTDTGAFALTESPADYLPRADSERALAELESWVLKGATSSISLTGPTGMGKTLVLKVLAERLFSRTLCIYVSYSTLAPKAFAARVLDGLGKLPGEAPQDQIAGLARAEQGGLLLLLDDANLMPPAMTRALDDWYHESQGALRSVLAVTGRASAIGTGGFSGDSRLTLEEPLSFPQSQALLEAAIERGKLSAEARGFFDLATLKELHHRARGVPARLLSEASLVPLVRQQNAPEAPAPVLDWSATSDAAAEPLFSPTAQPPSRQPAELVPERSRSASPAASRTATVSAPSEGKRQRPSGAIERARLAEQAGAAMQARQAGRTRPVERPCPPGLKVPILDLDPEAEIVRARQRRPPSYGFRRGLVLTAASYASTFGGGVLATLILIPLLGGDPTPQVIPMVAAPPAARDDSVGETTRGSIGFEREVVPGVADTPAPRITASVEGNVEARVARPNIAPPSSPVSAGLPAVGAGPPAAPAPAPPPASLTSATAAVTPAPLEAVDDRYSVTEGVIRQGEWLAASFRNHRIPMPILTLIDREVGDVFDFTRSQPGHRYSLTRDSAGELVAFRYFIGAGEELRVRRTGQGYAVTLGVGSDTEP